MIEKYVQQGWIQDISSVGVWKESRPYHTKGGDLANAANSCASDWFAVATCPAGTTDSAWNSWAICALAVLLLCLALCEEM